MKNMEHTSWLCVLWESRQGRGGRRKDFNSKWAETVREQGRACLGRTFCMEVRARTQALGLALSCCVRETHREARDQESTELWGEQKERMSGW